MKLIVAPNYKWFLNYCQEHSLDPKDRRTVRYVTEPGQLEGWRSAELVKLGNWLKSTTSDFRAAVYRFEQFH